jgi:hypothetical protein
MNEALRPKYVAIDVSREIQVGAHFLGVERRIQSFVLAPHDADPTNNHPVEGRALPKIFF